MVSSAIWASMRRVVVRSRCTGFLSGLSRHRRIAASMSVTYCRNVSTGCAMTGVAIVFLAWPLSAQQPIVRGDSILHRLEGVLAGWLRAEGSGGALVGEWVAVWEG